jgi:hypothetical protein
MEGLYPIIRRVRRPLLVVASQRPPAPVVQEEAPMVENATTVLGRSSTSLIEEQADLAAEHKAGLEQKVTEAAEEGGPLEARTSNESATVIDRRYSDGAKRHGRKANTVS